LTHVTAKGQQTKQEEEQEKYAGICDAQMAGWYLKQDERKRDCEDGASRNRRQRQNKRERTDEAEANDDGNRLDNARSTTKRRSIKQESPSAAPLLTSDTSAVDARGDGFLKPILSNNND
jgi:hypothetical protein